MQPNEQEKINFCMKYGTYMNTATRGYEEGTKCKNCGKSNLPVYIGTTACVLCLPCTHMLSEPIGKEEEKPGWFCSKISEDPVIHEQQIRCFIAPSTVRQEMLRLVGVKYESASNSSSDEPERQENNSTMRLVGIKYESTSNSSSDD